MANVNFPDVPVALGVPPVQRNPNVPNVSVERLTKDADSLSTDQSIIWGIFGQSGGLALRPDNITAFEFQREYRISDYPIEEGSFESFNKVTLPYDIRVVMTKGGSLSDRKTFLDAVDAVVASLDLYTIVTPERAYVNANLVRQDYRREATSGVSLLMVELHAVEIRTKVSVQFSSSSTGPLADARRILFGDAHAPSGANPRVNGSVQPVNPRNIPSGSPLVSTP